MLINAVSTVIIFAGVAASAQTNISAKYAGFDQDSPARKNFILSQNAKVNERLANSANRQALEAYIKKRLEVERPIKSLPLMNDGDKITAVDKGLHIGQDVVLIPKEGDSQLLFSTSQISKNNQYRISNLQLNISQNRLAIILYPNGSADDSYLYVMDLLSKKLILSRYYFSGRRVFWMNDNQIIFKDITPEGTVQIKSMVLSDSAEPVISVLYNRYDIEGNDFDKLLISSIDRDHFVLLSRSRPPLELTGLKDCLFQGEINEELICSKSEFKNGVNFTDLYSFNWNDTSLKHVQSIPGNLTYFNGGLSFVGKEPFLAYVDQKGYEKTVYYNNLKTGFTAKLNIPDYITVDQILETENPDEFELELSSDLTDKTVVWNTKSNEPIFTDAFKKEMLESETLSLQVNYIMVKSFDGTPVPVRIVHKKDLTPSKAPVLMEVYGGFGASGYMDPFVNRMNREFIKRGGVYVGPGLRGGNEYGEGWHRSAMRENKIKTYEDLASVAKYLIESGISEKSKIAIAGTSNGGLTVAATGLLFPQYFGLVLATNGVLDLLAKQMLDRRFDGWADEYGDPTIPTDAEFLSKISPLENVARAENGPSFLILNGRKDTRVNPAHSIKFAKAAEDLKAAGKNIDVELLSLNNSGHGMAAPDNDYISLRYRLVFWTRIYDAFGLSF